MKQRATTILVFDVYCMKNRMPGYTKGLLGGGGDEIAPHDFLPDSLYSQCSHLNLLTIRRFRCVQIFLEIYTTVSGTNLLNR